MAINLFQMIVFFWTIDRFSDGKKFLAIEPKHSSPCPQQLLTEHYPELYLRSPVI